MRNAGIRAHKTRAIETDGGCPVKPGPGSPWGVVSPEAKGLQVAMSPPCGIYPRTRHSQGCGVPAMLSHRDLPALAPSPEGERGPSCLRPSPDLARPGQTDRQTEGRSSPGSRTRQTRRRDPAGGGGLGAGRVEEGEETDPPNRRDTGVTECPAGPAERNRVQAVCVQGSSSQSVIFAFSS